MRVVVWCVSAEWVVSEMKGFVVVREVFFWSLEDVVIFSFLACECMCATRWVVFAAGVLI